MVLGEISKAQAKARGMNEQAAKTMSEAPEIIQRVEAGVNDNMQTLSHAANVWVNGINQISREWRVVTQQRFKTNLDAGMKLMSCRTLQDAVAAQNEFAKTALEQAFNNLRRIAELSIDVADKGKAELVRQNNGQVDTNLMKGSSASRRT